MTTALPHYRTTVRDPKINKNQQNPQDTCSKIPGRVFSEGAEPSEAGHHQSHSSGELPPRGELPPGGGITTSGDFSENVDFSKFEHLNIEKCMIYSRKIEIFKCQYTHFAHIRLSFGCTDEKIDSGLY